MRDGRTAISFAFLAANGGSYITAGSEALENDVGEESHDGGTDETRDGHGHKPGHEDVAEQTPIHSFPGTQPTHGYHRTNLGKGEGEREG